jgi:hypothetical protein
MGVSFFRVIGTKSALHFLGEHRAAKPTFDRPKRAAGRYWWSASKPTSDRYSGSFGLFTGRFKETRAQPRKLGFSALTQEYLRLSLPL